MQKFKNAQRGDKVWHITYGWSDVVWIDLDGIRVRSNVEGKDYFIEDKYTFEGKLHKHDIFPSLFWNEVKLPADNEDKKPFNLIKFLKENIEPKEFEYNARLFTLEYSYDYEEWRINDNTTDEKIDVYFVFKIDTVDSRKLLASQLNKHRITFKELKQAYKQLNWI